MLVDPLLELGGKPEIRCEPIARALAAKNECLFRFTETCGRLRQRIKHGFEIEGRATDDLEHVGRGGLLLEGLAQLVEQARVLDGDDGLIREGLDQRELLGSEGSNLRPPHRNCANEDTFATHRHTEKGPDAAGTRSLSVGTPVRIGLRIEDLDCPVLSSYAPDDRAVSWPNHATVCPLSKLRRGIVIRDEVVHLTVPPKDEALLGRAKPRRAFDQSVENGLKLECRAANDLEHVSGGGLLLKRFAQLVEQPRVLDGDDGLTGKAFKQVDLLFGEGANLL